MILPGDKASSLKSGENSAAKKKSRSRSCKGERTEKTKMEELPWSKTLASLPLDADLKNYFGKVLDDPRMKIKLLELIPRDPAQQTAEGVQEFVKVVSSFIDQKNPFKEAVSGREKHGPSPRSLKHPTKSEEIHQSNNNPEERSKDTVSETLKLVENKQPEKPTSDASKTTVTKRRGFAPKKSENFQKIRKESKESKGDDGKAKPSNLPVKSQEVEHHPAAPSGKAQEKTKIQPTVRNTSNKTERPSEIPLRKIRLKRSKPVSLLLQKPLKQTESTVSIDGSKPKKAFTPIEENSVDSELPITATTTEDTVEIAKPEEPSVKANQSEPPERITEDIKLERSSKSQNIPLASDPSIEEVTEKKSSAGGRPKILDLEKVKSTSITILTAESNTLSRLESLHRQNISAKENGFNESSMSAKTKRSSGAIREKSTNKTSSTRSSSKENRQMTKNKGIKMENHPQCGDRTLHVDISREVMAEDSTRSTSVSASQSLENSIGESNTIAPRKGKKKYVGSGKSEAPGPQKGEKPPKSKTTSFKGAEFTRKSETGEVLLGNKNSESLSLSEAESIMKFDRELEMIVPSTPPPTPEEFPIYDIKQINDYEKHPKTFAIESEERGWNNEKPPVHSREIGKPPFKSRNRTTRGEKTDSCEKLVNRIPSLESLKIAGKALRFWKDEDFIKPEEDKMKVQAPKEDAHREEVPGCTVDDLDDGISSYEWLLTSCRAHNRKDLDNVEDLTQNSVDDSGFIEKDRSELRKTFRTPSSLKRRAKYKMSTVNVKSMLKKKHMRSDAGDRWLPMSRGSFDSSMSFPEKLNKTKPDAKMRSGLTKSHARESKVTRERKDPFGETAVIKLRRRNSEPYSCRGFIWKQTDGATPRGHKPSVSSMASSLKHLNTDDMDDFIFWEAVPQKMTSCWEMSLYHFKRPWSVLSCSVFDDNRQSSTPGLILDNLRNGGTLHTRRFVQNQNERMSPQESNRFDVEPSIAQKNIDIRNWLAALNFQSTPSTSTDILSEGNFPVQSLLDPQHPNNTQINSKRRKVLPGLKFSDEFAKRKVENDHRESAKWRPDEVGDLMELIRRKSGGFVTTEQYFNPEPVLRQPSPDFSSWTRSSEERLSFRKEMRKEEPESITPPTPEEEKRTEATLVDREKPTKNPPVTPKEDRQLGELASATSTRILSDDPCVVPTQINIWKYLFLTLLFIIVVYFSLGCHVCRL